MNRVHTPGSAIALVRSTFHRGLTPGRLLDGLLVGAAVCALASPAQAQTPCCLADLHNGFDIAYDGPNGYELDFKGDVRAYVPAQVTDDPFINPFAAMYHYNGAHLNATTVIYDPAAGLTRVLLSGDPLPYPVPPINAPHHLIGNIDSYHTGLNQGWIYGTDANGVPLVQLVSRHWVYGSDTQELDAVNVLWTGTVSKKTKSLLWLATFVQTLDPVKKQPSGGFWKFTAYDPASRKPFVIVNNSGKPVTLLTLGIESGIHGPTDPQCQASPRCQGNADATDSLNDKEYPAPGLEGSRFVTMKVPRQALPPGESFAFKLR